MPNSASLNERGRSSREEVIAWNAISEATNVGSTQTAWFGAKDYLLRYWKYSNAASGALTMAIDYRSVSIAKPSPVKPFSSSGQ